MRYETLNLPVSAVVGVGSRVLVENYVDKLVQVQGWTVGTFHLEESITGGAGAAEWQQVGANITGDGFRTPTPGVKWMRVRTSVGGAVPVVVMGYRHARTDV